MFIINPYIFSSGYTIENALMLDGAADYLARTPTSAGSTTKCTWSFWVKRSKTGDAEQDILNCETHTDGQRDGISFGDGSTADLLSVRFNDANDGHIKTKDLMRDVTAWQHWVVAIDTTQSTASNRVKIYKNGTQITDFQTASYPAEDYAMQGFMQDEKQHIGTTVAANNYWFNGYLAEFVGIDGSQLDASSFGEYDDNGVWVPINPSGLTFGTNGFQLNFSNANALGLDVSRGATHPGTVDLQISFDGSDEAKSTTDESANSHTVTFEGDAELDTAQYKFSPSSLLLDGTGDYVKCADNADWRLGGGTGDFTVEFFARLASGVTAAVMVGQEQNSTTDFWAIYWNNSAGLQFINRTGNTNTIYFAQGSNSLSVETWYHIALVRSGSVFTFYVNGSSVATASDASPITDFSGELRIGHNTGSGAIGVAAFNGHIDEFRLINGGAVYNGNFTALTAAFSAPENKTNNSFTQVSIAQSQQVTDTCTDDADNNIGNHATWNPSASASGSTFTNGNKTFRGDSTADDVAKGTIAISSGKYYWRIYLDAVQADGYPQVGIQQINKVTTLSGGFAGSDDFTWVIFCQGSGTASPGGQGRHNSSETSQILSGIVATDYIDHALDMDAGKLWWGRNGTFSGNPAAGSGEAYSGITGTVYPFANTYTSSNATIDITGGTAPSGYGRLSTANLPAPTVTDPSAYFGILTWQGNGTDNTTIRDGETVDGVAVGGALKDKGGTGTRWTPDFAWIKNRADNSTSWVVSDVVRTVTKNLATDTAAAEDDATRTTQFLAGGIEVGNSNFSNKDGKKTIGYFLKAGGSPSTLAVDSISSGVPSIASSVSAADHGGFSIGTFTIDTSGAFTIAHGLTRDIGMLWVKDREASGGWWVWSDQLGNTAYYLRLETADDVFTDGGSLVWNGVNPGASSPSTAVFSSNGGWLTNGNDHVFYAFARTPGLIGMGSYTGNASSDGPFVVVDDGASGFSPAFVMFKNLNADQSWEIHDLGREPYNFTPEGTFAGRLQPDTDSAESTTFVLQKHATGFKIVTGGASTNGSGNKFVYLAFAENPFGGDTIAQAKAR